MEDLHAEPVKAAVTAEIEARLEGMPEILLSADASASEPEAVAKSEPEETEITTEKETEQVPQAEPTIRAVSKSAPASSEPKPGDRTVIGGKPHIWIPGFGWIEDEGGGSVCTAVGNPGDELTGNKVGIMGDATAGSKGDINKQVGVMDGSDVPSANTDPAPGTEKYIDGILHVWVPGFGYVPHSGSNIGTVAEDMYENGHKIGIMGGEESSPGEATPSTSAEPEPTGDVIYIELQPPVTKDSSPPPYKPNGAPTNP